MTSMSQPMLSKCERETKPSPGALVIPATRQSAWQRALPIAACYQSQV
jgi:hypothetical protein